jgi:CRISPR-associated protein Csh1
LNEGGYKVRIANIDHVILPQFRESDNLDWEMVLTGIKKKADILFHFNTLEDFVKDIEDETEDIFWINFMAYESDGNFFKSTELIKDVSNFHFQKVIQSFSDIHWELKEANYLTFCLLYTL